MASKREAQVSKKLLQEEVFFKTFSLTLPGKNSIILICKRMRAETARAGFKNAARWHYLSSGEYSEGGAENVRNY